MKYNRDKSEWEFSSGRKRYAHTENLGITQSATGEWDIAYGYDGGFWTLHDSWSASKLHKEDLLELARHQIERWQAFEKWIAEIEYPVNRPDWIKCIVQVRHVSTYCGRRPDMFEWTFLDLEHAESTVQQESRLVPCEECLKAARSVHITSEAKHG